MARDTEKRGKFLEIWEQQGEQIWSVGESQRMCCLNRLPHSVGSPAGSLRRFRLHSAAVFTGNSGEMAMHH